MTKILDEAIVKANSKAECKFEFYKKDVGISRYSPIFYCKKGHNEATECDDKCPDWCPLPSKES